MGASACLLSPRKGKNGAAQTGQRRFIPVPKKSLSRLSFILEALDWMDRRTGGWRNRSPLKDRDDYTGRSQ